MTDRFGRNIDYLRLSITDRCNLRCRYCMPEGVDLVEHRDLLRYEELLSVARAAVSLGITHFKVTGGEPLVRRGCLAFLKELKALPGVETVSLTTNGVLLAPLAEDLAGLGIDGVNVSLDTTDPVEYARITGSDCLPEVLAGIGACLEAGIPTKLNCVLLEDCRDRLVPLAELARDRAVDVRFIEQMPIGAGGRGMDADTALEILRTRWPDLHPVEERRGFGPAAYYASGALRGRIGFISALSHKFCGDCNRVRLTSTGLLKPCLCYGEGTDLRTILRKTPEELPAALAEAVFQKPQAHCFGDPASVTEQKRMNEIGG